MINMLDLFLCSITTIAEIALILIISLCIQLIIYKTTSISIYNKTIKALKKAEIYLDNNF